MLFSYDFFLLLLGLVPFFDGFNLCYSNQYFIISSGVLNCVLIPKINKVNNNNNNNNDNNNNKIHGLIAQSVRASEPK